LTLFCLIVLADHDLLNSEHPNLELLSQDQWCFMEAFFDLKGLVVAVYVE